MTITITPHGVPIFDPVIYGGNAFFVCLRIKHVRSQCLRSIIVCGLKISVSAEFKKPTLKTLKRNKIKNITI